MAYFDFSGIIQEYSRDFTVLGKGKGDYNDAGDYVGGGTTEIKLRGAIIGYSSSKIHRSEGTLTAKDKVLHMLEPIENALMGAFVVFKGNKYRIEEQKGADNAEFTGVYSYSLKWVSAFD